MLDNTIPLCGIGHTGHMTSRGVVRTWNLREMHGVIDSDDTPGGCWTFGATVAIAGFPSLDEGQVVEFEWRPTGELDQSYNFITLRAWPAGVEPVDRPSGSSAWNIDADGNVLEETDLDFPEEPRIGTAASGIVSAWHGDEGWGVIDSAGTPGGCWTYWSALHPDEVIDSQGMGQFNIRGGIHDLIVGEKVDFEWESVTDQDGYKFRAIKVRPRREIPPWQIEWIPS